MNMFKKVDTDHIAYLVELNDDDRIKLYQKILNPKNKDEIQMESELKLSLKMLFDELNKKYEIGNMQSSIMHVLVDLKIFEAFLGKFC